MTETVRNRDPYAEYISYDPDTDDYDPLTSVLQPPVECNEEITRKQISAISRRIDRGGDPVVVNHYYRVLRDLQDVVDAEDSEDEIDEVSKIDACYVRAPSDSTGHKRTGSNASDLSTTSTRCPEPADENFGFEVETEARHQRTLDASKSRQPVAPRVATNASADHRFLAPAPQVFPAVPTRHTIGRVVYCSPTQIMVTSTPIQPAPALAGWPGMRVQYTYAQANAYATPLVCAGHVQ